MDHATRTLERQRDAGDPSAQDALIRARLRAGHLRVERLALLALCGHGLARELTGVELELASISHRIWKRAFRGAGKVASLSSLSAALRAVGAASRERPEPGVGQVLTCVEAWCLLARRDEQEALVEKQRKRLKAESERSHPWPREGTWRLAAVLLDRELDFASESAWVMSRILSWTRGKEEVALAPMREVLLAMTM